MDVEKDRARYEADRAKDIRLGGTHGIDEIMKKDRLDAIFFPGANGAAIAAKPGYPTVTVPFALVPNAPDAAVSRGVQREARADGRELHGHGVQRAAAPRARVRVRAGDEEARAAAVRAVAGSSRCSICGSWARGWQKARCRPQTSRPRRCRPPSRSCGRSIRRRRRSTRSRRTRCRISRCDPVVRAARPA